MAEETAFIKELRILVQIENSKRKVVERMHSLLGQTSKPKPKKFDWKRFEEGSRMAAQLNY